MNFLFLTIIIFFCFQSKSLSQKIYLGAYVNCGYSTAINSSDPKVHYETSGKVSYKFGGILKYQRGAYSFELELGYQNLGYSKKITQGFTPSNEFPIAGHFPIYSFSKKNYNYTQIGIKAFYSLTPKVQLGLGLHPSKISGNSSVLNQEILIAGQSNTSNVIYGSYHLMMDDIDDYKPYNIFLSININYYLWKYIVVNIAYSVSLSNFNSYDNFQKVYHQDFSGGLNFLYPLK